MEEATTSPATTTATGKRPRDDEGESSPELTKRLQAELLLDILDDAPESPQDAGEDLASVMRSLEVEIALSSSPRPATAAIGKETRAVEQHELGYLLEASDDELGIPPTTLPSTSDESVAVADDDPETDGVTPGWSLGKGDAGCYDAFDLGFDCEDNPAGVQLPGGYSDDDLQIDLIWRPEFLPTV